jgi:hypothetical protein
MELHRQWLKPPLQRRSLLAALSLMPQPAGRLVLLAVVAVCDACKRD